ncbi:hypothetical protein EDD15DRAFT_2198490 [Pisolithus albus]|nr:hypothetical protein EDD15DRAFT_2198490 [Pisolithus albus]
MGQDDSLSGEDFDLDDAGDNDQDSESDTGDLDEMRRVLQVLGPTAEVHELRKALAIAQKAYADTRTELRSVRKELVALSSAIPARKRNRVLNRTETLDSSIAAEAKKYVMLYCFWVTDGVFPTTFNPNVDPRSPSRWNSAEAKVEGMTAELYSVIPESLHESMEQNKRFGSVANGTNHEALVPDEFLKSPIIVSIIRVLVFGKASLSNQKRGRPKARGQRLGLTSVTEGLIAGAATLARFLLSADPELGAVGAVTGIPYRDDFDFYRQLLFKRMTWAIDVMENINQGVFGTKSKPTNESLSVAESTPLSRTWEDDFLDEMESGTTPSALMPPADNAMNTPQRHSPPPPSPPSPLSDDPAAHTSTSVSSTQGNSVTASAVSQLQVEVSQLSVSNASVALPESASAVSNRAPTSHRISPLPAHPPDSVSASLAQPEPAKRNTRSRSTKSKAKK